MICINYAYIIYIHIYMYIYIYIYIYIYNYQLLRRSCNHTLANAQVGDDVGGLITSRLINSGIWNIPEAEETFNQTEYTQLSRSFSYQQKKMVTAYNNVVYLEIYI